MAVSLRHLEDLTNWYMPFAAENNIGKGRKYISAFSVFKEA